MKLRGSDLLAGKNRWACLVMFLLFFSSGGCISGPVRYKALGYHKSAIVEFSKRSPLVLKPPAFCLGTLLDLTIVVIETPVTVIAGVPIHFKFGGPDCRGFGNIKDGLMAFPVWYPVELLAIMVWPKVAYQDVFGKETGIFADKSKDSHPCEEK